VTGSAEFIPHGFFIYSASAGFGFTRDGGSVGGREITEPAPGSFRGSPGLVARNWLSVGNPNMSGMRMLSSGMVGNAGSDASESGSFLSSAFLTTGAGATTAALGATHAPSAKETPNRAQTEIFRLTILNSRDCQRRSATPQQSRLRVLAQGRSLVE
jgi:hypothetical protein